MRTHGTMRHYFVLSFRDERREKDRRLYNIQTLLCCHAENMETGFVASRCARLFYSRYPFLNISLFLNNIFFFLLFLRGYILHSSPFDVAFFNLRLVKLRLFFRSNIIHIKELSTFSNCCCFS
jgi:hypothetical protein